MKTWIGLLAETFVIRVNTSAKWRRLGNASVPYHNPAPPTTPSPTFQYAPSCPSLSLQSTLLLLLHVFHQLLFHVLNVFHTYGSRIFYLPPFSLVVPVLLHHSCHLLPSPTPYTPLSLYHTPPHSSPTPAPTFPDPPR